MTNSLGAPEKIGFFDRLRVAYTVYVRMGLSNIYDLCLRQEAFLELYRNNIKRNPSVAKYCAQKYKDLMKRRGGKRLEQMLGLEISIE